MRGRWRRFGGAELLQRIARFLNRNDAQRRLEIGDGVLAVALHAVGHAALVIGMGEARVVLDRLAEVSDGLIEPPLGTVGAAANVERAGMVRVDAKRFVAFG